MDKILLLYLLAHQTLALTPITSETASGPHAIVTQVLHDYKFAFNSWSAELKTIPKQSQPQWYTRPCLMCVECDWCILPPRQNSTMLLASWPGKPEAAMLVRPTPPPPGLPRTVTQASEGPRRTTIVRATATAEAVIDNPEPEQQDSLADKLKLNLNLGDKLKFKHKTNDKEITDTFYTLQLSGFHPAIIPLIVSPQADSDPLTLLVWANTTVFASYISSGLLADLGLSSSIVPATSKAESLRERDLRTLLGFATSALGVVNLNVIAGKDDHLVSGATFTVFDDSVASSEHEESDKWRPDVIVGMDFLNHVGAIKLTEEYSGSRSAGARDGMGVLVQRVFGHAKLHEMKTAESMEKDEL